MYTYQNKSVSYLGRPARYSVPVGDARGAGKRVVVIHYPDNGETSVRAMNGDGRKPSFVEHGAETLVNPSASELDAAVARMEALLG